MSTTTIENSVTTVQVYQVFIKATPEQIWEAIIDPDLHDQVLPRVADHHHSGAANLDLAGRLGNVG